MSELNEPTKEVQRLTPLINYHALTCNYHGTSLSSPGCVCIVVNKYEIEHEREALLAENKELKALTRKDKYHPIPGEMATFDCLRKERAELVAERDRLLEAAKKAVVGIKSLWADGKKPGFVSVEILSEAIAGSEKRP